MDTAFEILLPANAIIQNLEFKQPVFEWQNEMYPQGLAEAKFGYFKLVKYEMPHHVLSYLPKALNKIDWQCVAVLEGLLTDLPDTSFSANENNLLRKLLRQLTENVDQWIIVFEPGYDRIDKVLNGDIDFAYQNIISALINRNMGFIFWHKSGIE